jgi:hypothetical protein
MLPTQFIPNFFVADYYGLRNTIFWVTEHLASGEIPSGFKETLKTWAQCPDPYIVI